MKKKGLSRKQREQRAFWESKKREWDAVPKFSSENVRCAPVKWTYKLAIPDGRESSRYPSVHTTGGSTAPAARQQYTGTAIIGLAVMHKSSIVPIFSAEEAIDVAKMRRG